MNRTAMALLAAGLTVGWLGCQQADGLDTTGANNRQSSAAESANLQLVSLSVPNMV